jgi:transcriptional regulator with XRE-family HTH domain
MSTTEEILSRIKTLMGDKSLRLFANQVGVPFTTLSGYLRGRTPSLDLIVAVCTHTDTSADWLLLGKEPPRAPRPAGTAPATDGDLARAQAALARIRAAGDERCWTVVTATIAAADSQGGAHADGKSEGLAHTA